MAILTLTAFRRCGPRPFAIKMVGMRCPVFSFNWQELSCAVESRFQSNVSIVFHFPRYLLSYICPCLLLSTFIDWL